MQVPWIPALQKDTRARNTHSSTAIEGNPLTLEDVRALEEGRIVAAPTRARREVLNYFAALRHVEKQAAQKRLTHEDLFRLHAIIAGEVMDQGEAGRYRTLRVRVGRYVQAPVNCRMLGSDLGSSTNPLPRREGSHQGFLQGILVRCLRTTAFTGGKGKNYNPQACRNSHRYLDEYLLPVIPRSQGRKALVSRLEDNTKQEQADPCPHILQEIATRTHPIHDKSSQPEPQQCVWDR